MSCFDRSLIFLLGSDALIAWMSRAAIVAVVVGTTALGAGAGVGGYAALAPEKTNTVVRQITVANGKPASTGALSVADIYRRTHKGVVEITVTQQGQFSFGGSGAQRSQGSGFVYDLKGDIVTNEHVTDGASKIAVRFWNGASYDARLIGSDASTDLAVIRVDAPRSVLFPVELADSSGLSVGEGVVAIGSPFGLEQTVTSGIVSALHRQLSSPNGFAINDAIQTDAAINHGNSGGPLLDSQARVVGVNAQIRSDSGGNEGVGFAIPANTLRSIAGQILESGKAEHAYLGVRLDSTTVRQARITLVQPGTAAAKAGLRVGDLITAVAGSKVRSAAGLQTAIAAHRPGDEISVTFSRGGKAHSVELRLGTRPS